MPGRPFHLYLLTFLLAGCSSGGPFGSPDETGPAILARPVTCRFEEVGQIGGITAQTMTFGYSTFQVWYDAGANVTGLNVALHWEPSSPRTERLNLTAASPFLGGGFSVEGPPPLMVNVPPAYLNGTEVYVRVEQTPIDLPAVGLTNVSTVQDLHVEGSITALLPRSAETPPERCLRLPGPQNGSPLV